ncbi:hypothetical protein QRD02_02405 [Aequorivita sp. SDUM287046]|uniref:Uncharacterized protein n=1 Tax=Aequorivita aurantiaca TaxID=3053356 RepID=A0ABT8DH54_9FLAO|nr:hypothetical protein [Aequorivita aurantiaca]MDN3723220.1 hypothetical protein [Aequorivita aurantiaca]
MRTSMFTPKTFYIALMVAAPLFISCKDKEVTEANAPAPTQEATLEQKKQALQNVAPTTTSNNNAANSNGGAVNPPHGQPGHDCAIPVGAPLNGAGGTNTAPVLNKTETVPAAVSGKGINPPHGQPGHRCDLNVGDPL